MTARSRWWGRGLTTAGTLLLPACSLGLIVTRRASEEALRQPMGTFVTVTAETAGADLCIHLQQSERVHVTTVAVEQVTRHRVTGSGLDREVPRGAIVAGDIFLVLPVYDLACGVAAPFQGEYDVALGPLGVLIAVLVPGVTLQTSSLSAFEERETWDTWQQRRTIDEQMVDENPTPLRAPLRIVSDLGVWDVETDDAGMATVPLERLFGPSRRPGRLSIAHGDALYSVRFDGTTVTCIPVPGSP